ncbi:F-box domain-containing protein [Plasmodiophora brassicae]|uniref:F-box domain-containing protein n=1 Tax=Plasmodiophora brassicae TaxID=37360 RepID=A0A0G4ILP0_PLABS|nr:hypothetical protein PBRA_004739 [Plasmodiophora brassicae]SPQ93406.1 unnamed protein product [Plasmodiophora brassicae]
MAPDLLSLDIIMSFVTAEERAVLATVSRRFNVAARRALQVTRLAAASLAIERTMGVPGASPFGFGLVQTSICVVYRKHKSWFRADTGNETRRDTFRAYPLHVRSVGLGRDARCLTVMFDETQGEALVRDAATGTTVQRFRLREVPGLCWPISLSPCGRWLAFPFRKSFVNIGCLSSGRITGLPSPPDFLPRAAGFSFDGNKVVIGGTLFGTSKKLILLNEYDVHTHRMLTSMEIRGHQIPQREGFIEFSPTGRLVLLPTRKSIAMINLATKRIVHHLMTRSAESPDVKDNVHLLKSFDNQFATFSADGSWIVTTREKRGWLQIWDTATGIELVAIDGGHYWAWPLPRGGLLTSLRCANGWQMAVIGVQRGGRRGVKRRIGGADEPVPTVRRCLCDANAPTSSLAIRNQPTATEEQ